MKRSLLTPLLAVVTAACGGGAGTPTATNPGLPLVWAGSARFSESRVRVMFPGSATGSFEGTVTWQKDERPDPALPGGSLKYAISASQMHVTYHADGFYGDEEVFTCAVDGEAQVALQPYQGPFPGTSDPAEWESFLIVGQDGEYSGGIFSEATFSVTKACPGGFLRRFPVTIDMQLYIRGSLINGRRMQGEMPPDHFADTTLTGGWDFEGR